MNSSLLARKVIRYISIYGFSWTLFKIAGRYRKFPLGLFFRRNNTHRVGIIGCGQFSYSTSANFLYRKYGKVIVSCLDINSKAAESFSKSLKINNFYTNFDDFIKDKFDIIFIASNHSSHTEYAIKCMNAGIKNIYIEKPISVNEQQLKELARAYNASDSIIYAGFNRPFSNAVKILKNNIIDFNQKFFSNMTIWGHTIDPNHWYRDPKEGSRISGNLGHWIDLMVHILFWKEKKPDFFNIKVTWLDVEEYTDENFVMTIQTSEGDIFNFQFGARLNPFDGVSELIDFQCNNFCSRIIDFTRMEIDSGKAKKIKKFFPKDAGHQSAVLQPFNDNESRDFSEVLFSTSLTIILGNLFKEKNYNFQISSKEIKGVYKGT